MKKISNLLIMALLTVGMGLTSCDEQLDNAVSPGVMPVVDEDPSVTGVTTFSELQTALSAGKNVKLMNDIVCTAEIEITSDGALTIDGNGKKLSTTSAIRAFKVESSATVAFKNLTITGFVSGGSPAINNNGGTIVLDGCTISNCHVSGGQGGGAIENKGGGKLYAINTTFSGNYSGEIGGAINNYGGSLYMSDCTFTDNYTTSSNAFYGGAIGINGGSEVRLINCTFSGNKYGTATGLSDIGVYSKPTNDNYTIAGCTGVTIASGDGDITTNTTGTATLDYSDLSNISFTYTAEGGWLAGKFSVSATKKVYFSKGNLQATYDGSAWTWAFAEHQWDYIGGTENASDPGATTNNKINDDGTVPVNGTVDLFGWVGASNTTWTGAAIYGISKSTTSSDYGTNATEALKSDWGTLAISNGGNTANSGWYTLSSAEWTYLFQTRTDAAKKFGYATVADKYGIIIVPDEFTDPMKNGGSNAFVGSTTTGFDANVYTVDNWTAMEAAGCVFLPAAGLRNGTTMGCVGADGRYWSSSPNGSAGNAYNVFFQSDKLVPANERERNRGLSVRLVRPVE